MELLSFFFEAGIEGGEEAGAHFDIAGTQTDPYLLGQPLRISREYGLPIMPTNQGRRHGGCTYIRTCSGCNGG